LSDISATRARIHTKYLCRDNVCRRAPSAVGSIGPAPGGGEGAVINSKNWGGLIRAADSYHFYFFSAMSNVVQYVGHILVYNRLQGGAKSSKKFRIFHHFKPLRPYISESIKIEAYKQRTEKSFISPLSNCRMCLDPSGHRPRGSRG